MKRTCVLHCVATFGLALLLSTSAQAKRMPPPKVEPVIDNEIKYVAPNDDGRREYVQAWDTKTGKMLWEATVNRVLLIPLLEEDVQWVYIKRLEIKGSNLVVNDERDRVFHVDLNSRNVTRVGKSERTKKEESKSVAAYVKTKVGGVSACINGEVVVKDIESLVLRGANIETLAGTRHEFDFDTVSIGPAEVGLTVKVWTGAASGNGYYLLYSINDKRLTLLGQFDAESLKFLGDHVTNGRYDICTTWHFSARGGPYNYYRWAGKAYEAYKSGNSDPEAKSRAPKS